MSLGCRSPLPEGRESYEMFEGSRIRWCEISYRKAKNKLHKPHERVSETHEQTLHRQEQNRIRRHLLLEAIL